MLNLSVHTESKVCVQLTFLYKGYFFFNNWHCVHVCFLQLKYCSFIIANQNIWLLWKKKVVVFFYFCKDNYLSLRTVRLAHLSPMYTQSQCEQPDCPVLGRGLLEPVSQWGTLCLFVGFFVVL